MSVRVELFKRARRRAAQSRAMWKGAAKLYRRGAISFARYDSLYRVMVVEQSMVERYRADLPFWRRMFV
jgi:hypothetical protein